MRTVTCIMNKATGEFSCQDCGQIINIGKAEHDCPAIRTCVVCGKVFNAGWVREFNGRPEYVDFCGPTCSLKA